MTGTVLRAMPLGIDRASALPLYHQLKELLVVEIRDGGLQPGTRLPGDHDLCERYEVSRTVVRQALADLEREGVIERVKGRGTFVAQTKTGEGLVQSLTGLSEDVASRGGHLHSAVRRFGFVPADGQVAADLGLAKGHPVVELERLRYVDRTPWTLTIAHLRAELVPGLLEEDFSEQSLYAVLERRYQIRLVRGHRSVEATAASSEVASSLGIAKGAPVLVLRSVSYDDDDVAVESFVAFHRGDRSRFEVELTRAKNSQAVRPLMVVTGGDTPESAASS